MEAPEQAFFRETTRDVAVDGTVMPAGSRACLHIGSANRDDRHFPDPTVRHPPRAWNHLASGHAIHSCAGQGLAGLEARAVVTRLLDHVETIELAVLPKAITTPSCAVSATCP
jgi:cytochrome P450